MNQQITLISTFTLSLSILEDRDVEDDETFSLSLTTDDMGVNIMTDSTVITITDASEYCHIGVGVVCGVMVAGGIQGVLVILMYVYTLGLDQDRLRAVMRANYCTVYNEVVSPSQKILKKILTIFNILILYEKCAVFSYMYNCS